MNPSPGTRSGQAIGYETRFEGETVTESPEGDEASGIEEDQESGPAA